jgi:diguanylate cyclase (GGDEF)-like protein
MNDRSKSSLREGDPEIFSLAQIMHLMRVEFARAQRYDYPLACLLISVDGLSRMRDVHGYDAKQAVLDEVARLLKAETRSCDFLGRLMDDRLLAVVPHTRGDGARVLGERLLAGVRKLGFESGGKRLPITISIGATHNEGGSTLFFDALLQAGEGALAESVAAGGDRLSLRDPDGGTA